MRYGCLFLTSLLVLMALTAGVTGLLVWGAIALVWGVVRAARGDRAYVECEDD